MIIIIAVTCIIIQLTGGGGAREWRDNAELLLKGLVQYLEPSISGSLGTQAVRWVWSGVWSYGVLICGCSCRVILGVGSRGVVVWV